MPDNNYLQLILSADRQAVAQLYASLFPGIRKLVLNNGGTEADAKDLFQDAVIVVYEKARKPGFELTSKFSTFFYGICINLWRSRRQKKSTLEITIPEDAKYIPDKELDTDLLHVERGKLLYKSLRQLGADCQKLLELFFQNRSMVEIAHEMGYSNEGYARLRKSQCKDKLVEQIKKTAEFAELQTD